MKETVCASCHTVHQRSLVIVAHTVVFFSVSYSATDLAEIWNAYWTELMKFMNVNREWVLPLKEGNFLAAKKLKNHDQYLQFGASNFGTEANFCMLKTAVELEENILQDVCSTLTFDLWM